MASFNFTTILEINPFSLLSRADGLLPAEILTIVLAHVSSVTLLSSIVASHF